MKQRSRLIYFALISFAVAAMMLPVRSFGQNLRYQNQYSKAQVGEIIQRAENSSDAFRTQFKQQMDSNRSLTGDQKRQFNQNVADCENAFDRLSSAYKRENSWWRTKNQVQDVINSSQNVNLMMNSLPFRHNLEKQWNSLRNDINTLADTFDLAGLDGGGWNGGGNGGNGNGGGWNGNGQYNAAPSWCQGTFYSTNGSGIQLNIAANGQVTAIVNGQTFYGTYYNGNMTLNGDTSNVRKSGSGIQTYNNSTGQTTDYSRNGHGGGNGGGWNGNGNTSAAPRWCQGTFRSNNGSNITLSIAANGQVTAYVSGQTFYGNYYQGQIMLNGDTSTVSKNGNGIKTYNQSTGQTTFYNRQ